MSTIAPAFAAAPLIHSRHVTAFAATILSQQFQQATCSRPRVTLYANREPQQEEDVIFSVLDKITQVFSAPTPGFNSLALGYPLALLASTAFLPLTTSIFSMGFFVAYASLGRSIVVGTENDQDFESTNTLDLACFLGAIASAGILSPSGFGDGNGMPITLLSGSSLLGVLGVVLVGLAVASTVLSPKEVGEDFSSTSVDKRLLDMWDERFRQDDEL